MFQYIKINPTTAKLDHLEMFLILELIKSNLQENESFLNLIG